MVPSSKLGAACVCARGGAGRAGACGRAAGGLTVTSREKRAPRGHTAHSASLHRLRPAAQKYFGILFLQSRGCTLYMRRAHTVHRHGVMEIGVDGRGSMARQTQDPGRLGMHTRSVHSTRGQLSMTCACSASKCSRVACIRACALANAAVVSAARRKHCCP